MKTFSLINKNFPNLDVMNHSEERKDILTGTIKKMGYCFPSLLGRIQMTDRFMVYYLYKPKT